MWRRYACCNDENGRMFPDTAGSLRLDGESPETHGNIERHGEAMPFPLSDLAAAAAHEGGHFLNPFEWERRFA